MTKRGESRPPPLCNSDERMFITEPTRPENRPLAWRSDQAWRQETTAVDPFAEQRARAAYLDDETELPADYEESAPRAFLRL